MLTYENFQKVFEQGKKPYWWLYQGKNKASGVPIGSNYDDGDLTSSISELNDLIECYGDGVYTIEVKSAPTSPKNNPVHTFVVGNPVDNSGIGRTGAAAPVDHSAAFTKGIDMRYWMDKVDSLTKELRTQEIENIKLTNTLTLERMKRKEVEAANNQPDGIGRILNVIERQPQVLESLVGLFTNGKPLPAAIGVLKSNSPIPPAAQPEGFDDDEDGDDYDEDYDENEVPVTGYFSIDRAVNACYRLIKALPDQDINLLLEQIAATAETNPDKIKMALKFL